MKRIFLLLTAASFIFSSCSKDDDMKEYEGQTTLSFDAKVGSSDFQLNTDFTINSRTYNFTQLRYWISNVSLVDAKGSEYKIPASYYLVEETGTVDVQDGSFQYPATKREDILIKNIPIADYKQIKFAIGVDQQHNDNLSLQGGELSQLNGMTNVSWMWHTSYIFSTLQGTVKEGAATETFKAETGLNTNYKTVTLDFPAAVRISSAKSTSVQLEVDIAKVLEGVDLIATPVIGAAETTEMNTLATNYATKAITVKAAL